MAADARAVNLMPIGRDTSIEGLFEAVAIEFDDLGRRDFHRLIRRNLWQQVGGGETWRWKDALPSGAYLQFATNNRRCSERNAGGITTYRGITNAGHLCPSSTLEACHP
jgi:hypothetical protein